MQCLECIRVDVRACNCMQLCRQTPPRTCFRLVVVVILASLILLYCTSSYYKELFPKTLIISLHLSSGDGKTGAMQNSNRTVNSLSTVFTKFTTTGPVSTAGTSGASVLTQTTARLDNNMLRKFSSIMSESDRVLMAATVQRLTDTLDAANISYHMCSGTLIGSYRHHGIVPWDDDVDIYVRWSDHKRMEIEFHRQMSADYVLKKSQTRWKVYSKHHAYVIAGWAWKYPFVDVCFTDESKNLVWDHDPAYGGKFRFARSTVYPLRRRPFMNMSLWAPNDVETYLKATYNISKCVSNLYIHKLEKYANGVLTVDCRQLWRYYPFVFHSKITSSVPDGQNKTLIRRQQVLEELKVGDRVISSFQYDAP